MVYQQQSAALMGLWFILRNRAIVIIDQGRLYMSYEMRC
jgi:hypothetical protein